MSEKHFPRKPALFGVALDPMARGFRRLGGSWTVKNRDALERATE